MDFSTTSNWTDRAVISKIMQEHDALRDKVRRIHSAIDETKPSAEEVQNLLRDFHSMLEFHFLHEESDGFFQEITDKAPHLVDRAKTLCEEHRQLLSEAAELCRFAAAGSPSVPWWRELRARCHEYSKRLMQHESDECGLLQEAHESELGSGD